MFIDRSSVSTKLVARFYQPGRAKMTPQKKSPFVSNLTVLALRTFFALTKEISPQSSGIISCLPFTEGNVCVSSWMLNIDLKLLDFHFFFSHTAFNCAFFLSCLLLFNFQFSWATVTQFSVYMLKILFPEEKWTATIFKEHSHSFWN